MDTNERENPTIPEEGGEKPAEEQQEQGKVTAKWNIYKVTTEVCDRRCSNYIWVISKFIAC